jgi:hypothetical protein
LLDDRTDRMKPSHAGTLDLLGILSASQAGRDGVSTAVSNRMVAAPGRTVGPA